MANQRERLKDDRSSHLSVLSYQYADGGQRLPDRVASFSTGSFQSMVDTVTPGYKKKITRGLIVNSPMSRYKEVIEISNNSWYNYLGLVVKNDGTRTPQTGYIDSGTMPATLMGLDKTYPLDIDVERLVDIAAADAWSGIDESELMGLVTLAESKKTYQSIFSILSRVIGIFRAVKKAQWKLAKRLIKKEEADNIYLEARYSLRPLYYDMIGIVNAWNKHREDGVRFTSRGKATDSADYAVQVDDTLAFGATAVPATFTGRKTVEVRSYVLYSVDATGLSKLQTWGFTDPFSGAVELVPFTFILNWFINIGATVATWSPKPFAKILASGYTVTSETVYESHGNPVAKPDYYANQQKRGRYVSGRGTYKKVISEKNRYTTLHKPIIPSVDLNLTFWKILDIVLILRKLR